MSELAYIWICICLDSVFWKVFMLYPGSQTTNPQAPPGSVHRSSGGKGQCYLCRVYPQGSPSVRMIKTHWFVFTGSCTELSGALTCRV